jgi:SAM-dependent methyltransferase
MPARANALHVFGAIAGSAVAVAAAAYLSYLSVCAFERAVAENFRCPRAGAGFSPARWAALRVMRAINRQSTEDAVRRLGVRDGDVVVEIGAGFGFGIRALAAAGLQRLDVWAVEISAEFRRELRVSTDLPENRIVDADAKALHAFLSDGSVDKILAVNVVYFLSPLEEYLREMWRVLRPGGVALLACKWLLVEGAEPPFVNTSADAVHDAVHAAGFELSVVNVDLSALGDARYSYQAVFCRKPPPSSPVISRLSEPPPP